MNKHRSEANAQRRARGESLLSIGPKYTVEESNRIRELASASTEHHVPSASQRDSPVPQVDDGGPFEPLTEPRNDHHEFIIDQLQGDDSGHEERVASPRFAVCPPDAVPASVNINDQTRYESVRDMLDSSDASSEGSKSSRSESDTEDDVLDLLSEEEDVDVDERDGFRAMPREQFLDWAMENRKWIELAVQFGTTQSIMNQVLLNLDAPYRAWITIFRNIVKYSGLKPVTYLCCRSHMLFADHVITAESPLSSMQPSCSVCEVRGTTPDYCKFEYIPLLPRLRSWVRNEESHKELFDYRNEHCYDRNVTLDAGQEEESGDMCDYFDGTLYKNIVARNGGEQNCSYDLFFAPSTDGFDLFSNRRYDCWPIVAINLNLDPSVRFLMRNVIPFGFIGGRTQPANLESFLIPLVRELNAINANGGTAMVIPDGSSPQVRAHVVWTSADLQGLPKFSGHLGPGAKRPCLCCDVHTFYAKESRSYYLPSVIKQATGGVSGSATRLVRLFDPSSPHQRVPSEIEAIFRKLRSDSGLSERMRASLRTESGVKGRTILYDLPTIVPFHSFPIDTMHLGYNISKDLLQIFKGENEHLLRIEGYLEEELVIEDDSWEQIDNELNSLSRHTSECTFGPPPRPTSVYRNWKASEHRQFVLNYWLVLLDGHLPRRIMAGLSMFTRIVDLWSRPSLQKVDIDELGELALDFFNHFEREYYRYDRRRVGLCKLTIHILLHLKETVLRCGPPVNYSQFWVERYIGFIKSRLHARSKAAEALTQSALFFESFKLFFDDHFKTEVGDKNSSMTRAGARSSGNESSTGSLQPMGPVKSQSLNALQHRRLRLRELLILYITETESLTRCEAEAAVQNDSFTSFGGLWVGSGATLVSIGSKNYGRKGKSRESFYIACEFSSDEERPDENAATSMREIYYGRALILLQYSFNLGVHMSTRDLLLADWASGMRVNELRQVYKDGRIEGAFSSPTICDASAISGSIGVVEHTYPVSGNFSTRRGKKTFFLDPQREAMGLLERSRISPDGVNRLLAGLREGTVQS